jgi:hypothetical protein
MEEINSWAKRGKCRNHEQEINFFPDRSESKAKRFCKGLDDKVVCPVLDLCKTYAIIHGEVGIWGGTCTAEREAIDPAILTLLRQVYRQEGLLEVRRNLDPEEFLWLPAEQQPECISPTVPQEPSTDPSLFLSA